MNTLALGIVAGAVLLGIFGVRHLLDVKEDRTEIQVTATLEKIIESSELSTFQAVYNGIAKVMNEKKSDKVDYYVSYQAKINAGFDFEELSIDRDDKDKTITITIPKIELTEVNVDFGSLDYMFENEKANTNTVSEQAYKACIADATNESENVPAIRELAAQNARNMMEALASPFVEQMHAEYELVIIGGDK